MSLISFASDLRPFPTSKCIEYDTPFGKDEDPPMIRCLSVSPDGQFFASGASDGFVRLWEVQTGRLLKSWDISSLVNATGETEKEETESKSKPVISIEWNPNRLHHCLLAAVGNSVVVIATGTGGPGDTELTDALLSAASACKDGSQNVKNVKASKAVSWKAISNQESENSSPISAFGGMSGPPKKKYRYDQIYID